MTPFLKSLAQKFISDEKLRQELYRYRFFFQNKRAGKFFHHYLKEAAHQGLCNYEGMLILPEVTTLPTFLRSKLHLPDEDVNNQLFLIFHLHNTYLRLRKRKNTKSDPQPEDDAINDLNNFYRLGKQILIDFNDIDLQLADPEVIFQNLHDLKQLESEPTDYLSREQLEALTQFVRSKRGEKPFEKKYSTFYADLLTLYTEYKQQLRREGLSYVGMLMRDTLESLKRETLDLWEDGKYNIFVGLNALTNAEREILGCFKESGTSYFYWDYDSILFDKTDLAGTFKTHNLNTFPEPDQKHPLYFQRDKISSFPEVSIISTPSKVAQAAYIGNELNTIAKTEEGRKQLREMKVAVVLANESLLPALLSHLDARLFFDQENSISEGRGESFNLANITMGYPIKDLAISTFLIRTLHLQKLHQSRKEAYWRSDEVLELLSHGVLDQYHRHNRQIGKTLIEQIRKEKLIHINDDTLRESIDLLPEKELLNRLFFMPDDNTTQTLFAYCSRLVDYFIDQYPLQAPTHSDSEYEDDHTTIPKNLVVLHHVKDLLNQQNQSVSRFKQHSEHADQAFTFEIQFNILTNLFRQARIPFTGEPLRGLQIMGILETRGLDFEKVYILDGTDGVLPKNTKVLGVIPHLIRSGFGLPTLKWQEQTRSYNFFRLISRARQVVALYDSRKEAGSKGEPSRYLQQLQYIYKIPNLNKYSTNYDLVSDNIVQDSIEIDRDKVKEYIRSISPDGTAALSPSRINDYIDCPRKFYFKTILGLEEEDRLDDLITENILGTLVHDTINKLYKNFEGKYLEKSVLTSFLENSYSEIRAKLHEALNDPRSGIRISEEVGINAIHYDTILALVRNIIQMDLDTLKEHRIKYLGGEIKIETTLNFNSQDHRVNVKGYIDRIDQIDDQLFRVIDYKTGKDRYELDLERNLDLNDNVKINRAAIQLLNYCMIVDKEGFKDQNGEQIVSGDKPIKPLMIKPRSKENTPFILKNGTEIDSYRIVSDHFETHMREILSEITNEDNDFPPNNRNCNYCPANTICPDAKVNNY